MKRFAIAICLALVLPAATASPIEGPAEDLSLEATLAALDNALFHAFNRCADPAQLHAHARFFAPDVEFYHDTGGVTWTRDAMIANTRKHACGKYTRTLVAGSLRVSPIKDFGAIAQGTHRFCQTGSTRCEGEADFVMVWRQRDGKWQVTRVLSYGHRPNQDAESP